MMKIKDMPLCERPRERLWSNEAHALKASELIAILIRSGTKGASALYIAEQLLLKYGDLSGLCRASAQELSKFKGIGPSKAVQLKAAFALGVRLQQHKILDHYLDEPSKVKELLFEEMSAYGEERVKVLALDSKTRLIGMEEVSKGTVDETIVHPREILKIVIQYQAKSFVLAHNHPSGDVTPSHADLMFTLKVNRAAEVMDIPMADHVIIGQSTENNPSGYYSFKQEGKL